MIKITKLTLVLLFTVSLAKANITSGQSDYDVYAGSIVAYGVEKRKMGVTPKKKSKTVIYEDRCVFYPIFKHGAKPPSDYRGWSIRPDSTKKYPLLHLQSLQNYRILDERASVTKIKYTMFELVWNDYPNYFVGAPVPKNGCGTLVVLDKKQRQKKGEQINIEKYVAILDRNEKMLVNSAICSVTARKVIHPHKMVLECEKIKKSANLQDKSRARYFFDGRDHYLVRSYSQPRSLLLFRIDTQNKRLVSVPGFIGLGAGEQYLHMEYLMYIDIDNDGTNELLIKQYGWEWSGYGYLKKKNGYWH